MKIQPGIGIGAISYGISEDDLFAILGKPDFSSNTEYVEGTGDWHTIHTYDEPGLSFTFNLEDDYRLGAITVFAEGHPIYGRDVFGMSRAEVELLLLQSTGDAPIFEDFSIEGLAPHFCLTHDKSGITFWFESDRLNEMQCGYLFEDDDNTVIWPTKKQNKPDMATPNQPPD